MAEEHDAPAGEPVEPTGGPQPEPPRDGAVGEAAEAGEPALTAEAERVPTPGEQLRAAREQQGLSVGDVARQLKLATRQVEAMERDDHAVLPGSVFVRGFLRNYARVVGLDGEALVRQAFGAAEPPSIAAVAGGAATSAPAETVPLNVPVDSPSPGRRRAFAWIVAGAVVAAIGTAVAVALRRPAAPSSGEAAVAPERATVSTDPAPAVEASTPPPTGETSGSPAAASGDPPATAGGGVPAPEPSAVTVPHTEPASEAAAEGATAVTGTRGPEVRLRFRDQSWVEIRDGEGQVIFSQLSSSGSERVVRGKPPLELVVGNAPGVSLVYRGKTVDLVPHTRTGVARLTLE